MRNDLEEILRVIDDRSVTLIFTNGFGYSRDRAKSLRDAGLFYSGISVDSPYAEEHNRVRRNPQAFDHALTAIQNSLDAGLYTMLSSVVFRRDLAEKRLRVLFRLAQERGVHEVRIHQPIPRGRLTNSETAGEVIWTDADVKRWLDFQEMINQSEVGVRISSFPYTEGPRKFGCNAGLLHLYVTAKGDVWPCDFVPVSFGNLLNEPLRPIYERMKSAAGIPHRQCWAKRLAPRFSQRELPLDPKESTEFCKSCEEKPQFGDFFRTLQECVQ